MRSLVNYHIYTCKQNKSSGSILWSLKMKMETQKPYENFWRLVKGINFFLRPRTPFCCIDIRCTHVAYEEEHSYMIDLLWMVLTWLIYSMETHLPSSVNWQFYRFSKIHKFNNYVEAMLQLLVLPLFGYLSNRWHYSEWHTDTITILYAWHFFAHSLNFLKG